MKKGESPSLTAKWWKDSQPKGLKSAGKLDDALKDYESAKAKLERARDADAGDAAGGALGGIESAVKAVIAEAAKAKGAPEMEWTADALKKLDRLIDGERRWIAENADEEDGMFSDPDVYHGYLTKALKRLRSAGEMNFGVVLGKKAENHRIALHKAKGGKALAGQLARETGLHVMTFGVAMSPKGAGEMEAEESDSDEQGAGLGDERASVLILNLEGRPLPGLKKKLTKMLKRFKPLPYKTVKLMLEGKEVEDVEDLEDTDTDDYDAPAPVADFGALTRELAALLGQIQNVKDPGAKGDLARLGSQARAMIGAQNAGAAAQAIEQLRAALARALGSGGVPANDRAAGLGKSGAIWTAMHAKMAAEYDKLRAALVEAYKDNGLAGEIETRFKAKIAPVLQTLNGALSGKLAEASKAPDARVRDERVKEVRELVKSYKDYATGEPLLTDLDNNPFVPLKVREDVLRTLTALEQAI